ncbi:MAG: hypothetical protein ABI808_08215 [Pseudonocardiales bacterium]
MDLEHPEQLAQMAAEVASLRTAAGDERRRHYDVVAALPPGTDPSPYADAGLPGGLWRFLPHRTSADLVRGVIADGPLR